MYSPRNNFDKINSKATDDLNSLMQPMTEQLNLINIYDDGSQNKQPKTNSVDSLLIHNTPSPPQSFINYPNFTLNNNQPVSYRKVRPEPIR
jgi:hypothetical protein